MKRAFLALAASNLALMAIAAGTGLMVSNAAPDDPLVQQARFTRHFLLGLLSALLTCGVQVVSFVYFVVGFKLAQQSARIDDADHGVVVRMLALKTRAVRAAIAGIVAVVATAGLGAATGVGVPPEAHLAAAFLCLAVNGASHLYVYGLIDASAGVMEPRIDDCATPGRA